MRSASAAAPRRRRRTPPLPRSLSHETPLKELTEKERFLNGSAKARVFMRFAAYSCKKRAWCNKFLNFFPIDASCGAAPSGPLGAGGRRDGRGRHSRTWTPPRLACPCVRVRRSARIKPALCRDSPRSPVLAPRSAHADSGVRGCARRRCANKACVNGTQRAAVAGRYRQLWQVSLAAVGCLAGGINM